MIIIEFKIYDKPQKGSFFLKDLIQIRGYHCEKCNLSQWLNEPIKLEVHHINGDKRDNTLENLQMLCPNCHAYTDNYGIKNIQRIYTYTDEEIVEAIKSNINIRTALTSLGLSDAGANYKRVREILYKNPDVHFLKEKEDKEKIINHCPCCGQIISDETKYCLACAHLLSRTVIRPERSQLKNMIRNQTFVSIAKFYGVSDNAIRQWCKMENLPYRKKDINTYSDEEWELI